MAGISYEDLRETVRHEFGGSWNTFFRAVQNPEEILGFLFQGEFRGKPEALKAWAEEEEVQASLVEAVLAAARGETKPRGGIRLGDMEYGS